MKFHTRHGWFSSGSGTTNRDSCLLTFIYLAKDFDICRILKSPPLSAVSISLLTGCLRIKNVNFTICVVLPARLVKQPTNHRRYGSFMLIKVLLPYHNQRHKAQQGPSGEMQLGLLHRYHPLLASSSSRKSAEKWAAFKAVDKRSTRRLQLCRNWKLILNQQLYASFYFCFSTGVSSFQNSCSLHCILNNFVFFLTFFSIKVDQQML